MRGVDKLVYSESSNVLRLGLLKHVLELCKLSLVVRPICRDSLVSRVDVFGCGLIQETLARACRI